MRGLAAAIMLQGHVFDGWLRPQDRGGEWFWLCQFLGGLPAPIFLFLFAVSLGMVLVEPSLVRTSGADCAVPCTGVAGSSYVQVAIAKCVDWGPVFYSVPARGLDPTSPVCVPA